MSNFKHSNVIIFVFLIFDFQIQIYSMDFEKDANTYYNSQTNLDIEVGTPVSKFYDKNGPLHCAVMYNHIVTVEKIACHMDNNIDIKNIFLIGLLFYRYKYFLDHCFHMFVGADQIELAHL